MKITRKELKEIIEEVANELGLLDEELTTKQKKLPQALQAAILKKQGTAVEKEEDEDEEVAEGLSAAQEKLPEPLKQAILKKQGDSTDEDDEDDEESVEESVEEFVGDDDDDDVEEGNAFGAAVKKAKEAGEDEFEVDGKTYKVEATGHLQSFSNNTLSETLARISGKKKILND